MIQYVYENCAASGFDSVVVTDDKRIEDSVRSFNGNVIRVDEDVETGSERIALAYKKDFSNKSYKYIINVQGDEPLLISAEIQKIAKFHKDNDYDIATAVKRRSSNEEDFKNQNSVKCIYSEVTKACLYFSRESIPYSRDQITHDWFQHIGIYSYKVDAL
jgi:3-deoxy-manno-octulosonate cytidylyltransferase (CMP-KDO synthetase)